MLFLLLSERQLQHWLYLVHVLEKLSKYFGELYCNISVSQVLLNILDVQFYTFHQIWELVGSMSVFVFLFYTLSFIGGLSYVYMRSSTFASSQTLFIKAPQCSMLKKQLGSAFVLSILDLLLFLGAWHFMSYHTYIYTYKSIYCIQMEANKYSNISSSQYSREVVTDSLNN